MCEDIHLLLHSLHYSSYNCVNIKAVALYHHERKVNFYDVAIFDTPFYIIIRFKVVLLTED
jgi:hypothetical protein